MSSQDWQKLQEEADSGALQMNPDGLGDAPKQMANFVAGLADLTRQIRWLGTVQGFGDFEIGNKLAGKYQIKGQTEIVQRIRELADEATKMQQVFRTSINNFAATERANAEHIAQSGQR